MPSLRLHATAALRPWLHRPTGTGYNGQNEPSFTGGRGDMTTGNQAAARRVTYQLETLWDYDYEPTHQELETLYETAKKNQWNGSTAIDWSRPVGSEGAILNVQVAFAGTNFFSKLSPEEQK